MRKYEQLDESSTIGERMEKVNKARKWTSKGKLYFVWDSQADEAELLSTKKVVHRVIKIIEIAQSLRTQRAIGGRIQCKAGARRSSGDIYRLYKTYFQDDVDYFDILGALYEICTERKMTERICAIRCPNVRKLVFWKNSSVYAYPYVDTHKLGEVGLNIKLWNLFHKRLIERFGNQGVH